MDIESIEIKEYIKKYINSTMSDYCKKHSKRYQELAELIPKANDRKFAIELGCTELFQFLLKAYYKYNRVMGTHWSSNIEEKIFNNNFCIENECVTNELVSIDLERELFPLESECVDFVLCSEVIEHLDIDPMFMLVEINRIMKKNGKMLITSPNCCSGRNFWKIAHGYRPHFFMQYIKNRSANRHNFEYDMRSLKILLESAGYKIEKSFTKDVFEEPSEDGLNLLRSMNLSTEDRGDCIFILCEKISEVIDRWPGEIYV